MINIYWNMTYDGNVNHSEEIPCLLLIQFGPPNHYLISLGNWWNSGDILPISSHSGETHTVISQLWVRQRKPSCLKVCWCALWWWVLADAWDGGGLSLRWLIKADILDGNELSWRAHLSNNRAPARAIVQCTGLNCDLKVFRLTWNCSR